ncbi:DHX57, partial [Symbiodinium sp. CCMP2456]
MARVDLKLASQDAAGLAQGDKLVCLLLGSFCDMRDRIARGHDQRPCASKHISEETLQELLFTLGRGPATVRLLQLFGVSLRSNCKINLQAAWLPQPVAAHRSLDILKENSARAQQLMECSETRKYFVAIDEATPHFFMLFPLADAYFGQPHYAALESVLFHHPAASVLVIGLERDGSMFQAYQREGYCVATLRADMPALGKELVAAVGSEHSSSIEAFLESHGHPKTEAALLRLFNVVLLVLQVADGGTSLPMDGVLLNPWDFALPPALTLQTTGVFLEKLEATGGPMVPGVPETSGEDSSPKRRRSGAGGAEGPCGRGKKNKAPPDGFDWQVLKQLLSEQKEVDLKLQQVDHTMQAMTQRMQAMEDRVAKMEGDSTAGRGSDMGDGSRRRTTLVFGGWEMDTPRQTIVAEVEEALAKLGLSKFTDTAAFTTGPRRSVALMNFALRPGESETDCRRRMHEIVSGVAAAKPFTSHQRRMWATYSKTKQQRDVAGHCSWTKRTLASFNKELLQHIDAEYGTGTIWLGDKVVASVARAPPQGTEGEAMLWDDDKPGTRPWVDLGAIAKFSGISMVDLKAAIPFTAWNLGGIAATDYPQVVADVMAQLPQDALLSFQEMCRDTPGWQTAFHGTWTTLQHRHADVWRGTGITFNAARWKVMRKKDDGDPDESVYMQGQVVRKRKYTNDITDGAPPAEATPTEQDLQHEREEREWQDRSRGERERQQLAHEAEEAEWEAMQEADALRLWRTVDVETLPPPSATIHHRVRVMVEPIPAVDTGGTASSSVPPAAVMECRVPRLVRGGLRLSIELGEVGVPTDDPHGSEAPPGATSSFHRWPQALIPVAPHEERTGATELLSLNAAYEAWAQGHYTDSDIRGMYGDDVASTFLAQWLAVQEDFLDSEDGSA